jgi:alpha-amylase/alpha-mannosidase (GH57 family)
LERYVCIHGHFYQPPRENPWLEAVEMQDSAYPYHDWNERIAAECYAPNSTSRILDAEGRIVEIVNNYSRISFNFGPTLLSWLASEAPSVYQAVLAADRESRQRFSGHGSALAQAYNHMILPLANARDKRTQVLWGIRDFEYRFQRAPEGMWLPETAVDLESLDILAQCGIKFTILSPYQASRVRPAGSRNWKDVNGGGIDPSMAYRIRLPSGRSLNLFFYDGPISRAVAFEDVLTKGEHLAHRLLGAFSDARSWPQLVNIATDGETYGHHKRHADMALAYSLRYLESNGLARLTNYGEYLEKHPPTHEVQIHENTSWSCAHGIERWRSACGCNSGTHPDWNQRWRGPLRDALDWLRDQLAPRFEERSVGIFRDPWRTRDEYISVVLNRSPENVERFLQSFCERQLPEPDRIVALKLLELQRQLMLMYTSCGWFFDEISGIETVQVIHYAGRALQLASELFGNGYEAGFLERLERAKSNVPERRDGRAIYEKFVKPAVVTLEKVAAHYAISSLFEDYSESTQVYCHNVVRQDLRMLQEGRARLAMGRAKVASLITGESGVFSFGALHLGDQNVAGGVREYRGEEPYAQLVDDTAQAFRRGDVPELIRAVDRNFGADTYSLRLLFRDEQRKIVRLILDQAMTQAAALYRSFYDQYATLARFINELELPLPGRFQMAVDFTLNEDLLATLSSDELDPRRVKEILDQVKHTGIQVDNITLEFAFRRTLERAAKSFQERPQDLARLRRFAKAVAICPALPFEVNLWAAQNAYFEAVRNHFAEIHLRAERGDPAARAWTAVARSLGDGLFVSPASIPTEASR